MIQTSTDDDDWVHRKSTVGSEDHTLLGRCKGKSLQSCPLWILNHWAEESDKVILSECIDAGFFMYFSTMSGKPSESALLESRTLYPKRKLQCLQFFYKMAGSPKDKLVIWVKMDDGTGTVRRMKKIHTFYGTLSLIRTFLVQTVLLFIIIHCSWSVLLHFTC